MSDPPAKRILVVEDDTMVLTLISRMLRRVGYEVFETMRAEQAIDAVSSTGFDAVLTDIFMPGVGGIEGIMRMRALKPDLPIIAMSAGFEDMSGDKASAAALKVGATAVIAKPVERDELYEILARHTGPVGPSGGND